MKRYLGLLFGLLLTILLTGCGGGGGGSANVENSNSNFTYSSTQNKITGSVSFQINKKSITQSIILKSFKFELPTGTACSVLSSTVNGATENVDITDASSVPFEIFLSGDKNECSNILSTTFSGDYEVTDMANGITAVNNKSFVAEISSQNNSIDIASNYNVTLSAKDGNSSIIQNNSKDFFFQIKDSDGNQVDDSKITSVVVQTLDQSKLVFDDDTNSKTYTSKAYQDFTLKGIATGTAKLKVTITIHQDGTDVLKEVTKDIEITSANIAPIAKIILDPSEFTVLDSGSQTITIQTLDVENNPLSTEISIKRLVDENDKSYGKLDNYNITTDSNGEASVTYTPPSDMSQFSGTSKFIVFTTPNLVSGSVKLDFPANDKVDKIILSSDSIDVTKGLAQNITIYTLNSNNKLIPATIDISAPIYDNKMLGSFSTASVTTDENGEASVTYSAPSPYDDNLDAELNVTFRENISGISAPLLLVFKPTTVETNATQYSINLTKDDYFNVDSSYSNTVVDIVQTKDTDTKIDSTNINQIKLTSLNHLIRFDKNSNVVSKVYQSGESIDIYTGTIAGIDMLNIEANIFDGEKNVTISQNFPITVSSGPTHTVSIVYVDTNYNDSTGLFEDRYTVHAVDKFGNPAKKGSKLYVGVVNGLDKNDANSYLHAKEEGNINFNSNTEQTEFYLTDSSYTFANVAPNDTLIVFANENRVDSKYLGGWNIDEIISDSKLGLKTKYDGDLADNLTFIVGNEKRYDSCEETIKVADFDSIDKSYTVGDDGTATLTLKYDPYLVGKFVSIYANSYDKERVGISLKKLLSGKGISSTTFTCDGGDSGKTCSAPITLTINERGGQALQNVMVGIAYDQANGCSVVSNTASTNCAGNAYVTVSAPAGETCTVSWAGSIIREY